MRDEVVHGELVAAAALGAASPPASGLLPVVVAVVAGVVNVVVRALVVVVALRLVPTLRRSVPRAGPLARSARDKCGRRQRIHGVPRCSGAS